MTAMLVIERLFFIYKSIHVAVLREVVHRARPRAGCLLRQTFLLPRSSYTVRVLCHELVVFLALRLLSDRSREADGLGVRRNGGLDSLLINSGRTESVGQVEVASIAAQIDRFLMIHKHVVAVTLVNVSLGIVTLLAVSLSDGSCVTRRLMIIVVDDLLSLFLLPVA